MKSTLCILYYAKRSVVKENGKCPVMGRITVNGINKQFSTGIEVDLKSWNAKANKVGSKCKEAIEVNATLESIKASMTKIYRGLLESDKAPSPERIKNVFFGIEKEKQQVTLLGLFNDHNEEYFKLIGKSTSKKTYDKYVLTKERLQEMLKVEYKISDIPISELTRPY